MVSRYQKKHSPTHTYRGYQSPLICFIPPLSLLQAGCPSCHPTKNVKALKAFFIYSENQVQLNVHVHDWWDCKGSFTPDPVHHGAVHVAAVQCNIAMHPYRVPCHRDATHRMSVVKEPQDMITTVVILEYSWWMHCIDRCDVFAARLTENINHERTSVVIGIVQSCNNWSQGFNRNSLTTHFEQRHSVVARTSSYLLVLNLSSTNVTFIHCSAISDVLCAMINQSVGLQ